MAYQAEDDRREIREIVQAIRSELVRVQADLNCVLLGDPDVLAGEHRAALARVIGGLDKATGSAYRLLNY